MTSKISLICPKHKNLLKLDRNKKKYFCSSGCIFEIKNKIPRFVPKENYCSSFGLQWNRYRLLQLDSFNKTTISRDRLTRLMGEPLKILMNKKVLEAGCGAGRFTEILLNYGAKVFAFDLSSAVEANFRNFKKNRNYSIIQADVAKLPFKKASFDFVMGIGFIQHTPSPEKTIEILCSYLKPGGKLVIDHYTQGYPITFSRRVLRAFLLKKSPDFSLRFTKKLVSFLWPTHRFFWKIRKYPYMNKLRYKFLMLSPAVDYHDAYLELGDKLLLQSSILDTHDTLTDYYKHLRSAAEIKKILKNLGMKHIETYYAGNGVEAKAIKPKGRL